MIFVHQEISFTMFTALFLDLASVHVLISITNASFMVKSRLSLKQRFYRENLLLEHILFYSCKQANKQKKSAVLFELEKKSSLVT